MSQYFTYLNYVIRHKWYVAVECFKVGLYWRGITHDLSKFKPSEFIPYANYFYGRAIHSVNDNDFNFAWLLHQTRNDHHWQWWVLRLDDGDTIMFPMSDDALLEMIADWHGAGKAIHGKNDTLNWYNKNKDKMKLHDVTRKKVEDILNGTG